MDDAAAIQLLRENIRHETEQSLDGMRSQLDEAEAARLVMTEHIAALEANAAPPAADEIVDETAELDEPESVAEVIEEIVDAVEGEGGEDEAPEAVQEAADEITEEIEETADEIAPWRGHWLTRPLIRRDV